MRAVIVVLAGVPTMWVVYAAARSALRWSASQAAISLSEADQVIMAFLACTLFLAGIGMVIWENRRLHHDARRDREAMRQDLRGRDREL